MMMKVSTKPASSMYWSRLPPGNSVGTAVVLVPLPGVVAFSTAAVGAIVITGNVWFLGGAARMNKNKVFNWNY